MANPVKSVYIQLTNSFVAVRFLTMQLREQPHRLLVVLSPELHARLLAETERRTTIANRATMTSVVRELIAEHCAAAETVTGVTV